MAEAPPAPAPAPIVQNVMMLPDEHVDAIRHEIQRTHAPLEVRGENGRVAVFKLRRGKLYGYERTPSGFVKHEVMKASSIQTMMQRPDVERPDPVQVARLELIEQLHRDYPDMPLDKREEQADIIIEARKTVLELIKQGVPPHVAPKLVTEALKMQSEDRGRLRDMATQYAAPAGERLEVETTRIVTDIGGNEVPLSTA